MPQRALITHNLSLITSKIGFQVRAIVGATLFKYLTKNHFSFTFSQKKLKFYYNGRFESNGRIAGEPYDKGSQ